MKDKTTYGVIGDVHGRDIWKTFTNDKSVDKWIFLGDYVDSFVKSNVEILNNLKDIIQYKKDNMDKVVLLIGNHDNSYIHYPRHRCSGFRPEMLFDIQELFRENKDLFQASYQVDNYLFTHAGVHQDFYDNEIKDEVIDEDENLSDTLNRLYEYNTDSLFDVGQLRGGYKEVGGIFWLDKIKSSVKSLNGYHHIVGHTKCDDIDVVKIDDNTSITFCDCQEKKSQYFKLIIKNK